MSSHQLGFYNLNCRQNQLYMAACHMSASRGTYTFSSTHLTLSASNSCLSIRMYYHFCLTATLLGWMWVTWCEDIEVFIHKLILHRPGEEACSYHNISLCVCAHFIFILHLMFCIKCILCILHVTFLGMFLVGNILWQGSLNAHYSFWDYLTPPYQINS